MTPAEVNALLGVLAPLDPHRLNTLPTTVSMWSDVLGPCESWAVEQAAREFLRTAQPGGPAITPGFLRRAARNVVESETARERMRRHAIAPPRAKPRRMSLRQRDPAAWRAAALEGYVATLQVREREGTASEADAAALHEWRTSGDVAEFMPEHTTPARTL